MQRVTEEELQKYGVREAYGNNTTIYLYTRYDPNCEIKSIDPKKRCYTYLFERQYNQYNWLGYVWLTIVMSDVVVISFLCIIGSCVASCALLSMSFDELPTIVDPPFEEI